MRNRIGLATFGALLFATLPARAGDLMVKGGVNFADAKYDPATGSASVGSRTAWVGGAGLGFTLARPINVQVEAFYAQTGVKVSGLTSGETEIKLDYLQVPITLRLDVPIPIVGLYVFGGPNLGVRLKSESTGQNLSLDETTRSIVWNFDAGAGVAISLAPRTKITVEGRVTRALSNAFEKDSDGTYKAQDFRALAGLRFGF